MREIDRIKKFVEDNRNDFYCEIDGQGWMTNNATTELIDEYDLLIVYNGEPVFENEIFRVNEYDFQIPEKDVLQHKVKKYMLGCYEEKIPDNFVCKHWRVREWGKGKWLILSCLSIENYLKSIEISNR